ncbi:MULTISPECIES: LysO family transporter [Clostridium]|uniref:Lysine exporter LysO family protein n=1 Tax=Clostridium senegalense TaxID=1465809 RepID=A0A6M0H4U7_9CLOT|nr:MULTISPECIES: LysO family transporter [Clostridium]NEU04901.1 lysine exporter LysO family protein [Clostridium senegalense]
MEILIALVIGMTLGYIRPLKEKQLKINGKLQQLGVVFLLFFMGASIGSNDEIIKNIGSIGLIAFIFSALSVVGSIVLVYFLSEKLIIKKHKGTNASNNGKVIDECTTSYEENI